MRSGEEGAVREQAPVRAAPASVATRGWVRHAPRMTPILLALSLAAAAAAAAPPAPAAPPPPVVSASGSAPAEGTLIVDKARDVEVRYRFEVGAVQFSAELPAGWSFTIVVDGNQDGKWGVGPGNSDPPPATSPDHDYGQDSRGSVFCSAYVWSSQVNHPALVYASSDCDGFPSRGSVRLGQLTARTRATIRYDIPVDELFGARPTAHLQICVWDMQQDVCQYSPEDPFVLVRPAVAAAPASVSRAPPDRRRRAGGIAAPRPRRRLVAAARFGRSRLGRIVEWRADRDPLGRLRPDMVAPHPLDGTHLAPHQDGVAGLRRGAGDERQDRPLARIVGAPNLVFAHPPAMAGAA